MNAARAASWVQDQSSGVPASNVSSEEEEESESESSEVDEEEIEEDEEGESERMRVGEVVDWESPRVQRRKENQRRAGYYPVLHSTDAETYTRLEAGDYVSVMWKRGESYIAKVLETRCHNTDEGGEDDVEDGSACESYKLQWYLRVCETFLGEE